MNNNVFVVNGVSNVGKTDTIKLTCDLLVSTYPDATKSHHKRGKERHEIITINKIKIGIESMGDPGSRLPKSLIFFKDNNCQIIICATRTRGATVDAVSNLGSDYPAKWYRHLPVEGGAKEQQRRNEGTAKKIAEDVIKLIEA
jgi:hypothetical protein